MRHPKVIISGITLAAVAAAGGITAAAAGGAPASNVSARATVRTAPAAVAGKTEPILVNGHGLPLYFYKPDTAAKSLVSGALAQLWPPLTSAAPAAGLSGKVTVLMDSHGDQVTYNGHPLYTFADDHADQVTGQGVQDFFVATPGLAAISTSSTSGTAPAAPSGGIGY
jgi:predicted lipoprotein with Yx(FWY)xxD motif